MSDEVQDSIRDTVAANDVVLFMKGTRSMPQCGFSSRVAGVLNYLDVEFKDVNVLENEGVREGIKAFSDWPTSSNFTSRADSVVDRHHTE